jgi:hypothetical protein
MKVNCLLGLLLASVASMAHGVQLHGGRQGIPVAHNLPPAQMLLEPGPGVGGPGPGVMGVGSGLPAGGYGAMGGMMGNPYGSVSQTVQVLFDRPEMMQVSWDVSAVGMYDSAPLSVPGRQNFQQGAIYRLKISNIENRPGLDLYPTLEIGPSSQRTAAYLAHSAIPVQLTQEDFDQVTAGNFVTKVIYVPDPEYQELALAGVDTLVSTRLDPGVDPVVEADRRGAILAIVRIGNKDLALPGTDGGVGMGAGMGMYPGAGGASGMGGGGQYISGVTGPNYGMPWTGTQIGLPGPPHIPLGGPAGLQEYTMHNHTAQLIPGPTPEVNVHVRQRPGLSYPRPADKVLIDEHTIRPPHFNGQPPADMVHGQIPPDCNPPGLFR